MICQRWNAFFKTLLQPAEGKPWSHILFQIVLSTCELCREIVQSVCFLVSFSESFFPCNPRIDHYFLSELVEDKIRSFMDGEGTCLDAAGFKLITSRPGVQVQSLLKAEVIKEHVLMESLRNIYGEKWLWEGNAHMYMCMHVCSHTHTHTSYLKCTRQYADSYLTRVSLDWRLLESKDWGFWLLNSQHYWVNYWMECWTQKDSGMHMWQCLSIVTPDCLRFAKQASHLHSLPWGCSLSTLSLPGMLSPHTFNAAPCLLKPIKILLILYCPPQMSFENHSPSRWEHGMFLEIKKIWVWTQSYLF